MKKRTFLADKHASAQKLPVVYITPEAKQRLDLYIQLCDDEISGLGKVSRLGNDFLIEEVYLFEQEVTAASTDLSEEAVSKFLLESIQQGADPSALKLWWHSHCSMEVFWSGTDESTAGKFSNGWMISVVGNKSGEYLARLDLYEPIRLTLDGLELRIHYPENAALREEIAAEIKEKVRRMIPTHPIGLGFDPSWKDEDLGGYGGICGAASRGRKKGGGKR